MTSKPINFIPILSVCLLKNFNTDVVYAEKIEVKSYVKIHMCFISYIDSSHGYDFRCVFLMNY